MNPVSVPRFSLILATIGRVSELDRMLASLAAQTYSSYELILVDQNRDDRLAAIVERWKPVIPLVVVQSESGASRARNAGLPWISGELVGFPDDDCWYPSDLLERVSAWFDSQPRYSLLSTSARDETGAETIARWPRRSCVIRRDTTFRTCATFCLFMRHAELMAAGGFDETLGPGSRTRLNASEDSDLAIRVIQRAGEGWYEKSLFTFHPRTDASAASAVRAFHYGAAFGYFLSKHRYGRRVLIYHLLRAFGGCVWALTLLRPHEARFYWNSLRGRIAGYRRFSAISRGSSMDESGTPAHEKVRRSH
jgi:glycosyltransferase involved in cell wall biosynthesis